MEDWLVPVLYREKKKELNALNAELEQTKQDVAQRREDAADALGFEFQGTFAKRVDGKFVGYGVEEWRLD